MINANCLESSDGSIHKQGKVVTLPYFHHIRDDLFVKGDLRVATPFYAKVTLPTKLLHLS